MPDTFAITVICVVLAAIIGAFFRGRSKDRCLVDFSGYLVTLEKKDGNLARGKMQVENAGLELVYKEPYLDEKNGQTETSYLLYKNEFSQIQLLARYFDEMTPENKTRRQKTLAKTYHPKWPGRLRRKIRNFFATVRDSVMELLNLVIGKAKMATPAGAILSQQDKYVSQIKKEVTGTFDASFEPLLEKHIGKKVVLVLSAKDGVVEHSGVLKDYTTEFLELLDVDYRRAEKEAVRKSDIIVSRSVGIVRHLGE